MERDRRAGGALLFDGLTLTDVSRILQMFYAGRGCEGCFARFYGRFEFYRPNQA